MKSLIFDVLQQNYTSNCSTEYWVLNLIQVCYTYELGFNTFRMHIIGLFLLTSSFPQVYVYMFVHFHCFVGSGFCWGLSVSSS